MLGEKDPLVSGVATLEVAGASDLAFVRDARFAAKALDSGAAALIAPPGVDLGSRPVLLSPNPALDFARIAAACNYREVLRCDDLAALPGLLAELKEKAGPMLIHIKVAIGSIPDLGRPTMTPEQVKRAFMAWYAA